MVKTTEDQVMGMSSLNCDIATGRERRRRRDAILAGGW